MTGTSQPGSPSQPLPPPASAGAAVPPAGQPLQVTSRATWLLAPNPGPMTFDGTNSWVLHEPGSRGAVIVDPGPDDPAHLGALIALAEELGGAVAAILVTHGHPDHTGGVPETARRTGAPVLCASLALGGHGCSVPAGLPWPACASRCSPPRVTAATRCPFTSPPSRTC